MSLRVQHRHRLAGRLGVAGGAFGVAAGAIQATVGTRIPEWTGAKAEPISLGLLTIGLSVIAGMAAARQRTPDLSVRARAACALGLIGPGLLCLSTVGRLWYLPAILLLAAGTMSIDGWRDTATAIAQDWFRILLSALGACEVLMAAGAAPVLMAVGAASGIALIAAAWLPSVPLGVRVGLAVLGTVPFAALAWTAIVPIVVAVVALLVAVPVVRNDRTASVGHGSDSGRPR
jgi:hypothetical protein